jgi:membrane-associated phospholipid phosphatase
VIQPLIASPPHASYPSGHATNAAMAALLMTEATRKSRDGRVKAGRRHLKALAVRIAENREVAGVHFPSDSEAGRKLAHDLFAAWQAGCGTGSEFARLMKAAQDEWR